MQIKIQLFAIIQDEFKLSEFILDFNDVCTCDEVLQRLNKQFGNQGLFKDSYLIKNGVYAHKFTELRDGDELTIIPPRRDGAAAKIFGHSHP